MSQIRFWFDSNEVKIYHQWHEAIRYFRASFCIYTVKEKKKKKKKKKNVSAFVGVSNQFYVILACVQMIYATWNWNRDNVVYNDIHDNDSNACMPVI